MLFRSKKKIKGNSLVYLDSANSSQKPKSVIERMSYFYENEFSNVGRSVHSLAVTATNRFEQKELDDKRIKSKKKEIWNRDDEEKIDEGNRTRYKGIGLSGSGNKKDYSKGPNEKIFVDYSKIRAKAPITNDGKKNINPSKNEVIAASYSWRNELGL